jgi:hypothetical protein
VSVVINEYGIDSLILLSTSPLMRCLVLVYGTTEACISGSNKMTKRRVPIPLKLAFGNSFLILKPLKLFIL